jgi:hypothetical protein
MQTRALVASLLLFLPGSLLAQDPPFRAGQWAAQFTGASFVSLGAIRFRSPTRALVLDVHVSGGHGEHATNDTLDAITSNASIDVRVGRRSYRSVTEKIVAQHSLGLAVGFDHLVSTNPLAGTLTSNGWSVGPFVDLGGVYLVTPHFGIGATGSVSVTYSRSLARGSTGGKSRTWFLSGSTGILFSATLFF